MFLKIGGAGANKDYQKEQKEYFGSIQKYSSILVSFGILLANIVLTYPQISKVPIPKRSRSSNSVVRAPFRQRIVGRRRRRRRRRRAKPATASAPAVLYASVEPPLMSAYAALANISAAAAVKLILIMKFLLCEFLSELLVPGFVPASARASPGGKFGSSLEHI